MLATGITTLGCGMTVCIAVWAGDSEAQTQRIAETYKFGNWVVTVVPESNAVVPALAADSPSGVQVLPASFTQVAAPPIPDDDRPEAAPNSLPPSPDPAAAPIPCEVAPPQALNRVNLYRQVYDSIPFSRAEYNANPSYRHDATMEFLFGQMRPTVIQRGTTKVEVEVNAPPLAIDPWIYNRYGVRRYYYPFYPNSPTLGRAYFPR